MSDRTNVKSMELFLEDLTSYEATVKVGSNHFSDYARPAEIIKGALNRVINADEADTYSMMRILAEHIVDGIDEAYSEFTILMLVNGSHDQRARQLIMAILYTTRAIVAGESIELPPEWVKLVDRNMPIYFFLRNYRHSDQKIIEETYSGNFVSPVHTVTKLQQPESSYTLEIGYAAYELYLTSSVPATVNVVVSPDIQPDHTAEPGKGIVISTNVLICPQVGKFILDKSIDFFDDARAQLNALECAPNGYIPGVDTVIELPGLFYSVNATIVSSNSGKTWRIAEFQILPPSLDRHF